MRVLLLIPTTAYRAADMLDAAAAEGVDVAVGADQPPVLAQTTGGGLWVDLSDPERAAAQIAEHHARHPLAAIVGVDEGTATIAACASQALGLPHNPPAAAAAAGNKRRFRDALTHAGVPQPPYRVIPPEAPAADAARVVNHYPAVIKPVGLAGSRGVLRADDAEAGTAAIERARAIARATDPATGLDPDPTVLVEGYLPGGEVALEGLLYGGELHILALFDKPDPLDGPTFPETIFTTPSRLPTSSQEAVRARTQAAVTALGLREGPIHAELRLTPDDGPVPLEVAARAIGGLCGRVLRFGAGVSLERLILRHALGRAPAPPDRETTPAGVMMVPIREDGRLVRVDGVDAARAVPGIAEVTITVAPGTHIRPLPEGDRYLGFLFARADEPARVEQRLREAAESLHPVIEPADGGGHGARAAPRW